MGRMGRRTIPFVTTLATVIVLLALSSAFYLHTTELPAFGIEDFYAISREVSLSELVQVTVKLAVPLYLPSTLPSGLKLTAIYLKEGPFIAIVVYSAEGNKDYKTAELTFEIVPTEVEMVPTYAQLQSRAENPEAKELKAQALEINGWPVMIYARASTGSIEVRRAKYGGYALQVMTWIERNEYLIGAPTLTPDEAIQLVRSMKPIS